ncbi:hypothetical protein D3C80_704370 [compost metagenome]
MRALAENWRGKRPVAVDVGGRGAHCHAVVIQRDGGVWLRRAGQRRRGVVGRFPVGQIADQRTDVIVNRDDHRRVGQVGKRRDHRCVAADVTGLIGGEHQQRFAVGLRR